MEMMHIGGGGCHLFVGPPACLCVLLCLALGNPRILVFIPMGIAHLGEVFPVLIWQLKEPLVHDAGVQQIPRIVQGGKACAVFGS